MNFKVGDRVIYKEKVTLIGTVIDDKCTTDWEGYYPIHVKFDNSKIQKQFTREGVRIIGHPVTLFHLSKLEKAMA